LTMIKHRKYPSNQQLNRIHAKNAKFKSKKIEPPSRQVRQKIVR
jgi:hypothetical protein